MKGTTEYRDALSSRSSEVPGVESGVPTSASHKEVAVAVPAEQEATTAQDMMSEFYRNKQCEIRFKKLAPIRASLVGGEGVNLILVGEKLAEEQQLRTTTINNMWDLFLLREKEIKSDRAIADAIVSAFTDRGLRGVEGEQGRARSLLGSILAHRKTILHWIAQVGKSNIVDQEEWLKELYASPGGAAKKAEVLDKTASSFLHEAVYKGNTKLLEILLHAVPEVSGGCDDWRHNFLPFFHDKDNSFINWCNKRRETALTIACWKGNLKAVNLLIAAGAKLNVQNRCRRTALIHACIRGHDGIVKRLIAEGADLNLKDQWKNTALIHACIEGHYGIVKQLVAAGADLNVQDSSGKTALMHACIQGRDGIVKRLIAEGADLNVKSQSRKTALDYASKKMKDEIRDLLASLQEDRQKSSESCSDSSQSCAPEATAQHSEAIPPIAQCNGGYPFSPPCHFGGGYGFNGAHFNEYHTLQQVSYSGEVPPYNEVQKPKGYYDATGMWFPVPQPPVLQPPVLQHPVPQPPVLQPPVLQHPVLQHPVLQPPVLQPPVPQPPVPNFVSQMPLYPPACTGVPQAAESHNKVSYSGEVSPYNEVQKPKGYYDATGMWFPVPQPPVLQPPVLQLPVPNFVSQMPLYPPACTGVPQAAEVHNKVMAVNHWGASMQPGQ